MKLTIEAVKRAARNIENPRARAEFLERAKHFVENGDADASFRDLMRWRYTPVRIDRFVEDPYFLNLKGQVYPKIMEVLEEAAHGDYTEVVLTGSIGWGKTFSADILLLYQLYEMSCLRCPQREYNLAEDSSVVFVMQSLTKELAIKVLFGQLSRWVRRSPYFAEHFCFDPRVKTELRFDRNINIEPVAGSDTAGIGINVAGALMDETNFRAIVQKSRRMPWQEVFDAAVESYNSMSRRMKSRFLKLGKLPGRILLVSSSRYPEDFTERKMTEQQKELREDGKSLTFVANYPEWRTKPKVWNGEQKFLGPTFSVVIGTGLKRSYILPDGEQPPADMEVVDDVPIEYLADFKKDTEKCVREIVGRPTRAINPFIVRRELIEDAITDEYEHPFNRLESDLRDDLAIVRANLHLKLQAPRAGHMDLSKGKPDRAAMAWGYVLKTVPLIRSEREIVEARAAGRGDLLKEKKSKGGEIEVVEYAPVIVIEGMLSIVAPPNDEIQLEEIVALWLKLRKLGVPIKWVTADQYASAQGLQMLRARKIIAGEQSVDTDLQPYENFKSTLYDRRIRFYHHPVLVRELSALEKDEKKHIIDHPMWAMDEDGNRVPGSKDMSDAVAGVVHTLARRRDSWTQSEASSRRGARIKRRDPKRVSVDRG